MTQYHLYPKDRTTSCFLIVGGLGDRGEDYSELIRILKSQLTQYTFCTFTLSQSASSNDELLAIQTRELEEVVTDLIHKDSFETITIYTSSMGAFATTQLIVNPKCGNYVNRVLYFDPADYYLEGNATKSSGSVTWSGHEDFNPERPTVSSLLLNMQGDMKIDVVHFTIKNYGPMGYYGDNFLDRGVGHADCFPRLNTQMVKSFYLNTPIPNRGRYLELDNLPHGYFRDGYLEKNLITLDQSIRKILLTES